MIEHPDGFEGYFEAEKLDDDRNARVVALKAIFPTTHGLLAVVPSGHLGFVLFHVPSGMALTNLSEYDDMLALARTLEEEHKEVLEFTANPALAEGEPLLSEEVIKHITTHLKVAVLGTLEKLGHLHHTEHVENVRAKRGRK